MYRPNLQSVGLAVPEIIVMAVLGWDCEPQSWGRGGRRGSGTAPFERALATSYRLSIVTYHLSLCVSEILPLLFSSTPLFPTPPLISPKFPPLGYEERRRWANCPFNYLPRFPTYVILIHQRHRQTDGQADDMQSPYRAMH